MPKAGKIIDNEKKIISKTERMIYLPRSYNLRDKTERMVDLPSIIYNSIEPKLITSNLIYFLDGAAYDIRGVDWYDTITKSASSKASPYDFGFGGVNPYIENRSMRLEFSVTNPLVTSLSSDAFNTTGNLYTLSIYVKINALVGSTSRILMISNDTAFSPYIGIFQNVAASTVSFRSNLSSFRYPIVIGERFMLTMVRNYDTFYYYVNDKFFRSDSTTLIPRVVSNTSPIILGNTTSAQPNINIYGFLAYNRTLTHKEIADNYEHLKLRYGSSTSNSAYNKPSVIP